jgi:hypothetical protein
LQSQHENWAKTGTFISRAHAFEWQRHPTNDLPDTHTKFTSLLYTVECVAYGATRGDDSTTLSRHPPAIITFTKSPPVRGGHGSKLLLTREQNDQMNNTHNMRINLTVHASRALRGSAPHHISPQGGAQGARHMAHRLSARYTG